jgi:serine protease Do
MIKASNVFALLIVFVFVGAVVVTAQETRTITPTEGVPFTQAFEVFDGGGSYLGVQMQDVNKENFSKFGLSGVRGVAVEKVLADSPAKTAGLQDGDVIVRFNGEEVSSNRKLTRLINETAPDHQAKLTVVRGGSERELTVTMGKRPTPKFEMGSFATAIPGGGVFERVPMPNMKEFRAMPDMKEFRGQAPMTPGFKMDRIPDGEMGDVFVWENGKDGSVFFGSTRQIGAGITSLSKQLGDYFGVADGKGLLISNVNENSPAAKAGLKAGDVIVEVEGKAVGNLSELIRGINEKKEGEVTLTILRNRNRQTVKVTPEKMKEGEGPIRMRTQPGVQLRTAPKVRIEN